MEVRSIVQHPVRPMVRFFVSYASDIGKTLHSLGVFGPLFLLLAVCEGVFPVLTVHGLGGWLDAVLGARAVGAVTSDLTAATRQMLFFFALSVVSTGFSQVLLGGRARIALQCVALCAAFFTVFILSFPIFISLFIASLLFFVSWFSIAHDRVRALVFLVVGTLFMSQIFWRISQLVMVRAYTVGEALSYLLLGCFFLLVCVYLSLPAYESRS